MSEKKSKDGKINYDFGGVKEFSLEQIEKEILNESVYLDVFAGSDIRFKENISKVSGALEMINGLEAVKYNYKTEEFAQKNFSKRDQIGFIAQDAKDVVPEMVKEDGNGEHYVNYSMLVPVLTEGIKELKEIVEKQQEKIEALEAKLKS
jgi:hypothetical protein